ncbi:MAG: hypothetical protein WC784_00915 [Candidatus Shapirobacteria bacterium]|jgi:hypothetical protein
MINSLREYYSSSVLDNRIVVDDLWRKRCLGYNIQYIFSDDQLDSIIGIQRRIGGKELFNLHLLPRQSLHISIAWILATRVEYDQSKSQIWRNIENECYSKLEKISKSFPEYTVHFQDVVATDTAIVLIAKDNGETAEIRKMILDQLPIPQETNNNSQIIHTTLFRYARPLENPAIFLEQISNIKIDLPIKIDSMSIRKELIYPSIKSKLLFSDCLEK